MMERDIFEDIRLELGCDYISDLPFLKSQIEEILFEFPLQEYQVEHICEFCEYIFGTNVVYGRN